MLYIKIRDTHTQKKESHIPKIEHLINLKLMSQMKLYKFNLNDFSFHNFKYKVICLISFGK